MRISNWLFAAFVFSAPAAMAANFENSTVNADFDLRADSQPTVATTIFYTEIGYSYITRSVQPSTDAWLNSQNFDGYAINVDAKTLELGTLLNDHAYDTAEYNDETYKNVNATTSETKEKPAKLTLYFNPGVIGIDYSF